MFPNIDGFAPRAPLLLLSALNIFAWFLIPMRRYCLLEVGVSPCSMIRCPWSVVVRKFHCASPAFLFPHSPFSQTRPRAILETRQEKRQFSAI
jgi:hypothetical protein